MESIEYDREDLKWYLYIKYKRRYLPIRKDALEPNDVVCIKNHNGFKIFDNSTVFVVSHTYDSKEGFEIIPLIKAIGISRIVKQKVGYPILPSEFSKYLTATGEVDEDRLDEDWGLVATCKDCDKWLSWVDSHMDDILVKRCAG